MNSKRPDHKTRVSGQLRSSLGDDEPPPPPPPPRPGSSVFNRMPRPPAPPPPEPVAPVVELPTMRRRWRPSGVVFPLLIVAAGVGAGYLLLETTQSMPFAIICWSLGLVGGVFCRILMRDRVEVR